MTGKCEFGVTSKEQILFCDKFCDSCDVGSLNCDTARDMIRRIADIEIVLGKNYDIIELSNIIKHKSQL